MQMSCRLALALCLPLLLAGCFASDEPLIAEADSVAPIAPGRYFNPQMDDASMYVLVTVNGTVTVLTSSDEEGRAEETAFLMRNLSGDHFIVMDRKDFTYSLVRVRGGAIDEYQEDKYCEKLQDIAKKRGVDIASFGVVRATADDIPICYFDDYGRLAGAFEALVEEKALEVGEAYKRAD